MDSGRAAAPLTFGEDPVGYLLGLAGYLGVLVHLGDQLLLQLGDFFVGHLGRLSGTAAVEDVLDGGQEVVAVPQEVVQLGVDLSGVKAPVDRSA